MKYLQKSFSLPVTTGGSTQITQEDWDKLWSLGLELSEPSDEYKDWLAEDDDGA